MISGKRLARTVAAAAIVLATTVAEPAAVAAQDAGETPARNRIERSPCRPTAGPCPCGVPVKRITATIGRRGPAARTVYGLVTLTLCVRLLDARLEPARRAPGA